MRLFRKQMFEQHSDEKGKLGAAQRRVGCPTNVGRTNNVDGLLIFIHDLEGLESSGGDIDGQLTDLQLLRFVLQPQTAPIIDFELQPATVSKGNRTESTCRPGS